MKAQHGQSPSLSQMDIRIASKSRRSLKIAIVLGVMLVCFSLWWWWQPPRLTSSELLFADVKLGTFRNQLQVSGQLKPLDTFWLVVPADGVLTSLLVRPGSVLKEGQLLASITSLTLEQEVRKVQATYNQAQAEYLSQQAQAEIDFSTAEMALLHAQHQSEISNMDVVTNAPLVEDGIVSRLQFEKLTKAAVQHELLFQAEQKRLQSLKRQQKARLSALQMKNQQLADEVAELTLLQKRLQVQATEAAVVTQLAENLTPGQTLVAGSPFIQFASSNRLYAELFVPAIYASSLQHDLTVTLHLTSGPVQGVVNRIDPRVVNDRITVDVVLPEQLPVEARAELAVRADILLSEQQNSVFVQRPFYVQADKKQSVFVLSAEGDGMQKRDVQFGAVSGNQIEIAAGLAPAEKILLSELTPEFFSHPYIMLRPSS